MDDLNTQIAEFFAAEAFAVIGASNDKDKYGNKVLKAYLQQHKLVYPVNPRGEKIEDLLALTDVMELPSIVNSISVVTNPAVTKDVVAKAILKGIKNIWLQPGSEYPGVELICKDAKINLIYNGPCVLVVMKYKEITE